MKAPLPPLALENALQELANQQKVQGKASLTLSLTEAKALVQHHGATRRQVERTALGVGIVPRRYQRNIGTIGLEGQMILLDATVAVVGCGGLGGWVAEALARMGVGRLMLIDGDVFEEDNLNRQLGCTERTLGALKAQCLAERLEQVNAAVEVRVYVEWLNEHNAEQLFRGAGGVVVLAGKPDAFTAGATGNAVSGPSSPIPPGDIVTPGAEPVALFGSACVG